jgi:DNA-directed RNA polymerase specialized sigma24 family protein
MHMLQSRARSRMSTPTAQHLRAAVASATIKISTTIELNGTEHETKPIAMNFTQMVEAEIPALRRHARAVTRDSDLADDIVQDTLVRALRSEHLFQGSKIRSWLHTILINLNRNRLRSLARQPRMSPIKENDASDFAGPEAGGRDIERALGTLAEDQRSARFWWCSKD